jgi:hypothetical protein
LRKSRITRKQEKYSRRSQQVPKSEPTDPKQKKKYERAVKRQEEAQTELNEAKGVGIEAEEEPAFEFEPLNEITDSEGYTSVNLNPEARIFIAGTEITGFQSVNVVEQSSEKGWHPNTAKIEIVDINNRYTLTRDNLQSVWTEEEAEKKAIFQLKYFSNLPVFEGQAIFEVNDPIIIFTRDRFVPQWRFKYHGFVNVIDNSKGYNSNQITLNCEDAGKFVRMKQYNDNPGIIDPFQRSMYEVDSVRSSGMKTMASGKNAIDAISSLFFGPAGLPLSKGVLGYTYEQTATGSGEFEHITVNEQVPSSFREYTSLQDDLTADEEQLKEDIDTHNNNEPKSTIVPPFTEPTWDNTDTERKNTLLKQKSAAANGETQPLPPGEEGPAQQVPPLTDLEERELADQEAWSKWSKDGQDLSTREAQTKALKDDASLNQRDKKVLKKAATDKEKKRVKKGGFGDVTQESSSYTEDSPSLKDPTGIFSAQFLSTPPNPETKYTFNLSQAILDALEDPTTPGASMAHSNIGYFKQWRFILPTKKDEKVTQFSQVLDPYELNHFYEEIPRWFLRDVEWGGNGYNFTFVGCEGINPLVTTEFVDTFNITPKLVRSIESTGKGAGFLADTNKDLRNVPTPYDVIMMNTKGSLHTLYVRSGNATAELQVNPRLIVVVPAVLTGDKELVELIDFSSWELFATDYETASDILGKILQATDLTAWTTPMGDLVVEPKYYDTNPWDWTTRGSSKEFDNRAGEQFAKTYDDIGGAAAKGADEQLESDTAEVLALEAQLASAQKDDSSRGIRKQNRISKSLERAKKHKEGSSIKAKEAKKTKDVHYIKDKKGNEIPAWTFPSQESFLDNIITEKDEMQTTSTIDSKKFKTGIEVKGALDVQVAGISTPQLIQQLGLLQQNDGKGDIPYSLIVADGFDFDLSYQDAQDLREKLLDPNEMKELMKQGQKGYSPTKDYIRRFGLNIFRAPSMYFLLKTSKACKQFAKILFNRFLSDAFQIRDISIFARAGLTVNRPVYINSRNSIVTPKKLSFTLTYGSTFSTSIQSGFLRNQALMEGFGFSYDTGGDTNEGPKEEGVDKVKAGSSTDSRIKNPFKEAARNSFSNMEWKLQVNRGNDEKEIYNFFPYLGVIDWNEENKK